MKNRKEKGHNKISDRPIEGRHRSTEVVELRIKEGKIVRVIFLRRKDCRGFFQTTWSSSHR